MPRAPLTPISSNINRRKELTPYRRAYITGLAEAGATVSSISATQNLPRQTIIDTIKKAPSRNEGKSATRPGRPIKATDYDKRRILRIIRSDSKITYNQLRIDTGLDFSDDTFYRILKANGITNWVAKKRPQLTEVVAKKRLAWAKQHVTWTNEEWAKIIWSDECSVERGSGKQRQWVFRTTEQKWQANMIQEYKKGRDKSVMIWAAFSGVLGKSELYVMDRDFESKKMGYSARSYLEVLEEMIPTVWEPGMIFMQDNAPIHNAKAVVEWFKERGIPVMEWPPYSPDLNPIEHLWWHLKRLVYEVDPDIEQVRGEENIIEALSRALPDAWRRINQGIVDSVLGSMRARCEVVIAANGWQTKY